MLYKQTAIITRSTDFSEKDKIISLLSKKRGRIDAIAKGVRNPKAKLSSRIDLLYLGEFQFAKGKNLDIITDVKLISEFSQIRADVLKSALAFYLLDLVNQFYQKYDLGGEIFDDFIGAIQLINDLKRQSKSDLKNDLEKIKLAFEAKTLDQSGFLENSLNESAPKERIRRFKCIKFFQQEEIQQCTVLKLTPADVKNIDNYLYSQILNIIEKEIKSYKYLKNVLSTY